MKPYRAKCAAIATSFAIYFAPVPFHFGHTSFLAPVGLLIVWLLISVVSGIIGFAVWGLAIVFVLQALSALCYYYLYRWENFWSPPIVMGIMLFGWVLVHMLILRILYGSPLSEIFLGLFGVT